MDLKQKYHVKGNLSHDHKQYAPGDQVSLTDAQAKGLLSLRIIELVEGVKAPAPTLPPEGLLLDPPVTGNTNDTPNADANTGNADGADKE